MASVAQTIANRLNARKSTGPRTPEGKAVVSQNAVKHGLLAREVFEDKVQAAKARDRKAYELFGPFAYLNFPDEIHAE